MVYLLCSFPAGPEPPSRRAGSGERGGLRPRGARDDSPPTKRLSPKYLCLYHLNVIFPLSPLSDWSELFKCKLISPPTPDPLAPLRFFRHLHRGPFPQPDLRTRLSPERSGAERGWRGAERSGAGAGCGRRRRALRIHIQTPGPIGPGRAAVANGRRGGAGGALHTAIFGWERAAFARCGVISGFEPPAPAPPHFPLGSGRREEVFCWKMMTEVRLH